MNGKQEIIAYFSMEIALEPGMPTYSGCASCVMPSRWKPRTSTPSAWLRIHRQSLFRMTSDLHQHRKDDCSNGKEYIPLAVIVAVTLLSACAKQVAYGGWSWMGWMEDFMGFYLVVFAMFKFFDLEGFADGFQKYDIQAKPFRPYACFYPFIELGLGLGYLAHWHPMAINLATVVVMTFGSLGVFYARFKGLNLEDACMGTVHRVPLSTVALLEDLGMALMAAAMLFV